jgi:hypothetical protein
VSSILTQIVINGGVINATGNLDAGIGSGFARNGNSTLGTIWFDNTPNIAAHSINSSAIGARYGNGGDSHVDSIIVDDSCSAFGFTGNSTVDSVTINYSHYSITSESGACIGAGSGYDTGVQSVDGHSFVTSLFINDGEFQLSSVWAAGIGREYGSSADSLVRNLMVRAPHFSVSAQSGAAIGSGFTLFGDSFSENLTIESGIFQETEVSGGSGVGSGFAEYGNSYVRRLLIRNGVFNFSVSGGSGLRSGYCCNRKSFVENIIIRNGSFTLSGIYGAGLGGGNSYSRQTSVTYLEIDNGYFNWTGKLSGARIGSGYPLQGNSTIGIIEIDGSTFYSYGYDGAGIESGFADGAHSDVGSIVIHRGSFTVNAYYRPDIGAGYGYFGHASLGSLTIHKGIFCVTVQSGAGIGAGYAEHGNSTIDTITNNNGSFNVDCQSPRAGIGIGLTGSLGSSSLHTITLNGGIIHVQGDYGASVDAGSAEGGNSSVGIFTLAGARVTAQAHEHGAGIGAGSAHDGFSTVAELGIQCGYVAATGYGGAGIGAGVTDSGRYSAVHDLIIESVEVNACSSESRAAIETGQVLATDGESGVLNTAIRNSTIVANGFVAIGRETKGTVDLITLSQGSTTTIELNLILQRPYTISGRRTVFGSGFVDGRIDSKRHFNPTAFDMLPVPNRILPINRPISPS